MTKGSQWRYDHIVLSIFPYVRTENIALQSAINIRVKSAAVFSTHERLSCHIAIALILITIALL